MNITEIKQSLPMKYWTCTNMDKLMKNLADYIIVHKMDGAWYRYVKTDSTSILQSRTKSRITGEPVEKQDNVPAIMEALDNIVPPNTVLVGEICFRDDPTKQSNDVVQIMGCLPQKAIERQVDAPLSYYVFDILMLDGEYVGNKPYSTRLDMIQTLLAGQDIIMPPNVLEGYNEIAEYLEQGWEGAVLMHKDRPYISNKPSAQAWTTVKIKQTIDLDIDLFVIDTVPPTREYKGDKTATWAYWENGEAVSKAYAMKLPTGSLVLGAYTDEGVVEVARVSNLTEELMAHDQSFWLNKVVTITGMSVDKKLRSIRHPKFVRIHADKNIQECLYSTIFED